MQLRMVALRPFGNDVEGNSLGRSHAMLFCCSSLAVVKILAEEPSSKRFL